MSMDEAAKQFITSPPGAAYRLTPDVLRALLSAADLLDKDSLPIPEPTQAFLEAGRGEALVTLAQAWMHSPDFDELRLLPSLRAEGEWRNDPLNARQTALDLLATIPGQGNSEATFWSLEAFVSAVRQFYPDFQRPAGDYDSWYLRQRTSGEYLRGFEHWDEVDGEYLRYLVAGPMHWLGLVDLATPATGDQTRDAPVNAFRWSTWAADLSRGQPPEGPPQEAEAIIVGRDATLRIPILARRAARYQAARFSEWQGYKDGHYYYRLTPDSLERARLQGLGTHHLLVLLRRHALATPPNLAQALERWERHGAQAYIQQAMVLRVKDASILESLRNSASARFLGDPLGPTAIIVKPGAWEKVIKALADIGYLGKIEKLTD
jgi:hypothetical protein